MHIRPLLLISLSLACLAMPLAFANDEDLPPKPAAQTAIALEKTTDRFVTGDWVYILDADKEEHPVIIQSFKDGKMLVATPDGSTQSDDGLPMLFKPEDIKARVGWWAKQWYNATRTRTGNWILAGAAAVVGGAAIPAVADLSVSSDKNSDQVNRTDLLATERSALENGPSDGAAYLITGTFTGGSIDSGTGPWNPSITFGANYDGRGGSILAVAMPPRKDGTPQVLEDAGSWTTLGQGKISLKGPKPYEGEAKISGIGSVFVTIQLSNNITLAGVNGATVQQAVR